MDLNIDKDTEKIRPPYIRTPEDVKEIIHHARLDERNLTPLTQAFYYPVGGKGCENLRLLELDSYLLSQIREGETIQFKGDSYQGVVLCTEEKTYEIKETETSNSLLLIPDLKFAAETTTSPLKSPKLAPNASLDRSNDDSDDEVTIERVLEQKHVLKIFYEYLECREIRPRVTKLHTLLMMASYSGPENEYIIDTDSLLTYDELLGTMQCSRKEFVKGLEKYRVLKIDGHMRILDLEYEYRVVNLMLGIVNENSWALDEVLRTETIEALNGIVPKEVAEGVFDYYTEPVNNERERFKYKNEMLARIVALNILRPGLKFRVEEFMRTWQEALMEGVQVDEKYLRGIGIIDRDEKPPCVRSLNEENITNNLVDRINTLFKIKATWSLEEIEPYLEPYVRPALNVSMILAKYARSYVVNGVRRYVAKHS